MWNVILRNEMLIFVEKKNEIKQIIHRIVLSGRKHGILFIGTHRN